MASIRWIWGIIVVLVVTIAIAGFFLLIPTVAAPPTDAQSCATACPCDPYGDRPAAGGITSLAGYNSRPVRTVPSMVITENGKRVEDVVVDGSIVVRAKNVEINNVVVEGKGAYGIRVEERGSAEITHSLISGDFQGACLAGNNWRASCVEFFGMTSDGIKMGSNSSLVNSWLHGFRPRQGAHADGIQIETPIRNSSVFRTVIDVGVGEANNSAVLISGRSIGPTPSESAQISVSQSYLFGGAYTFSVRGPNDSDDFAADGIDLFDNVISGGLFGPLYPGKVKFNIRDNEDEMDRPVQVER